MTHDHSHQHDTHDHGAGHSHGPGHVHAPKDFGWAFAIATPLNVALVAGQVIYGLSAHSMALLADAGHNAGDALGLLLAWGGHVLARWQPTRHYTYGFRSGSIMAAVLNAVILLVATGLIVIEAVQRLLHPEPVAALPVMIVAAVAIVLNGLAAWVLMAGRSDLNIRGAFLHMVADAGVSLGVVIAGAVILFTGWLWVDPAVSLVISAVIVWGTWDLLRTSVRMSFQAVPEGIDVDKVRAYLEGLPGVKNIHDLHIWSMSTTEVALTGHLVMPGQYPGDAFLMAACAALKDRFGVGHATLQIEISEMTVCALEPDHVV